MILHILSRSPFSCNRLTECIRTASAGDCLLLMGDGVYAALPAAGVQLEPDPFAAIYALADDLNSRGLQHHLAPNIETIDYERFVSLCCEADSTLSWY